MFADDVDFCFHSKQILSAVGFWCWMEGEWSFVENRFCLPQTSLHRNVPGTQFQNFAPKLSRFVKLFDNLGDHFHNLAAQMGNSRYRNHLLEHSKPSFVQTPATSSAHRSIRSPCTVQWDINCKSKKRRGESEQRDLCNL